MKQAIDYPYDELQAKPVGFVSNGCGYIGPHAVDQLRTVFTRRTPSRSGTSSG
ncbi:NAD(P)H-dependent oxidoreductase [Micromonospora sp. KC606]|uniref:NAD(P)H-dependent oxidoreductase n=1 Tax=Micromonospora sp. KC606 TaxID=2530379 RepID=UPI001FB628F8|nr:NAD(P)H-dependent oxidoreductase [Micromonospora sp. KC606]